MGNWISSASFATPATTAASSSVSYGPSYNVLDLRYPKRSWRATDCVNGSTYVAINFGVATTVAAFLIDDLNVASVKLQWSTDGSSWTDLNGGVAYPVNREGASGKYKLWASPTFAYKWFRVLSASSNTTDSTAGMAIGSIAALTSIDTWIDNPVFPIGWESMRATILNDDSELGGRDPLAVGNRYGRIVTAQNGVARLTMKSQYDTIIGTYGQHQLFALYRNGTDTSECYLCYRVGEGRYSLAGPNHIDVSSLMFEEPA